MADQVTSSFPAMGESIIGHVVNVSGQRVPYTMPEAKTGFAKGESAADQKNKKNRRSTKITGANGPRCRIVETIDYPNDAAESGKTYRNVKRVRGGSQFYSARAAAGSAYASD